ncbi:MAG TPA: hypothetical protein VEZ72_17460 [Paenibacillus sp.]|nr:hypothetical protein [Paenibacillus sp.]
MDVTLYVDLIKDDRGNYYTAVQKRDDTLVLANDVARRYRIEFIDAIEFYRHPGQAARADA